MTRKCKPGQRARVVTAGLDKGKVVLVVRRYHGEEIEGAIWHRILFPWVVVSLGAPLHSVYFHTKLPAPPSMTAVICDTQLQPLDDDDGSLDKWEGLDRPVDRPMQKLATV
jgi:hypothetical protein